MNPIIDSVEKLFDARASNLPASAFADILDRMIWCLANNGNDITELQRRWIRGPDSNRAEVGLMMEEVFPFLSLEEAEDEIANLIGKWPYLQSVGENFVANWKEALSQNDGNRSQ